MSQSLDTMRNKPKWFASTWPTSRIVQVSDYDARVWGKGKCCFIIRSFLFPFLAFPITNGTVCKCIQTRLRPLPRVSFSIAAKQYCNPSAPVQPSWSLPVYLYLTYSMQELSQVAHVMSGCCCLTAIHTPYGQPQRLLQISVHLCFVGSGLPWCGRPVSFSCLISINSALHRNQAS